MSITLFNPEITRKQVTPEGDAGDNVFIPLIGYGYWNPSGRELTFLTGEIVQKASRTLMGLSRPNTFRKDASSCNVAATPI
jgi:hypothetical protein